MMKTVKKGECPYSVSNAIRTLVMVDDHGLAFLRKSHGGCGVPPARRQEPPFESVIQKKAVTPKGMTAGCRKTPQKTDATEQRGVCAGGKKPTARSIKQDFETFLKVSKSAQRGEKTFSTRWTAFLVDDNGLEPLTLRTSSECSTS